MLILLFALVALEMELVPLEMELVPKGYYIDANVSTGRRLLRVVFTLNTETSVSVPNRNCRLSFSY